MNVPVAYDGVGPWRCTECEHSHTGAQWGWICIGCPCEFVPDHPDVSSALGLRQCAAAFPSPFVDLPVTQRVEVVGSGVSDPGVVDTPDAFDTKETTP